MKIKEEKLHLQGKISGFIKTSETMMRCNNMCVGCLFGVREAGVLPGTFALHASFSPIQTWFSSISIKAQLLDSLTVESKTGNMAPTQREKTTSQHVCSDTNLYQILLLPSPGSDWSGVSTSSPSLTLLGNTQWTTGCCHMVSG